MVKVLVVDVCDEDILILKDEFVRPILQILQECGYEYSVFYYRDNFFLDEDLLQDYDKCIICGTALKDNRYLEDIDLFNWILNFSGQILGICAGSQIIAKMYGAEIIVGKEIGVYSYKKLLKHEVFLDMGDKIYCLHGKAIKFLDDNPLNVKYYISTENYIQAFGIEENNVRFGVLFHPEVFNKSVIINFCKFYSK